MEKIYETANEQHVRATVVYVDSADSTLWFDEENSDGQEVYKDDLVDLFNKGLLMINDGTNFIRPTSLSVSQDYASVSYVSIGVSGAVATTFYSADYTAQE